MAPYRPVTRPAELMTETTGKLFSIRSKKTNLFLTVVTAEDKANELGLARVEQRPLVNDDANRASQMWYIFAVDQNSQLVVNKKCGLLLSITDESVELSALNVDKPTVKNTQMLWFRRIESADRFDKSYCYTIGNPKSFLQASVADASVVNNLWPTKELVGVKPVPERIDEQIWEVKVEETLQKVEAAKIGEVAPTEDCISNIDFIKDFVTNPIIETECKEVGRVLIPFMFVIDSARNIEEQAMENPYYVLHRFGFWKMLYHVLQTEGSDITLTHNVKVGLITGDATRMENVVGMAIRTVVTTGENGTKIGEILLRLQDILLLTCGVDIRNGLKVNPCSISVANVRTDVKMMTEELVFNESEAKIHAIWYRQDYYVLKDLNDRDVISWLTRHPTKSRLDHSPVTPDQSPTS